MRFGEFIKIQTLDGAPVRAGEIVLVPQSRSLTLRWSRGGFVWNRPIAVVVQQGAHRRRIPIVDITRVVQIVLVAFTLLAWICVMRVGRRS